MSVNTGLKKIVVIGALSLSTMGGTAYAQAGSYQAIIDCWKSTPQYHELSEPQQE